MKTAKKCVVYILMMALLLSGCAATEKKASEPEAELDKYPPYHQQLASLVGQPKQAVCEALNIEESQLVEEIHPFFETPITVEFGGVSFTVYLGFMYAEDKLIGFDYRATYKNDPETAAKDAITVAKHLDQVMGKPARIDKQGEIHKLSQAELQEKLNGEENYGIEQRWDLKKEASQAQKDMMIYLAGTEIFQQLTVDPGCYLELLVSYIVSDENAYIALRYAVGT